VAPRHVFQSEDSRETCRCWSAFVLKRTYNGGMDAQEQQAIELFRQGQRQIKEVLVFLAQRYGPRVISQCEIYVDSVTAQTMAEQVIEEALKTLGNHDGDDLHVMLGKAATKMAKAKRASMLRDLWKADQESQEQAGKTVKEREDTALLRYRRLTTLTWKQIAEIMGMTEGQAKERGHRALLRRPEVENVRRRK
jgi:hypothetical protein